ncbi:dockerin type I domain-containing protein [Acetivibrio cellulolyticus]|uniref:dockerin type I domain-containing protein n=1 Tax=Acetivibrio cellulolyticus TaxID=35830 RepID=UPI0001E2EC2A|nr:dockerin type I domain-containing protein [Acetivibrio cellulolyticus]
MLFRKKISVLCLVVVLTTTFVSQAVGVLAENEGVSSPAATGAVRPTATPCAPGKPVWVTGGRLGYVNWPEGYILPLFNTCLRVEDVNFGCGHLGPDQLTIKINRMNVDEVELSVRSDSEDGNLLGTIDVKADNETGEYTIPIKESGTSDIYVVLEGVEYRSSTEVDVDWVKIYDENLIPTAPPPEILKGDLNGDGVVNSIDFAYLRKYLLGMILLPCPLEVADLNNDGVINVFDLALFRKWILCI